MQNYYGTYWNNQPAYFTGIVTRRLENYFFPGDIDELLGHQNDIAGSIPNPCNDPKKPIDYCVSSTDMTLYYSEILSLVGQFQPSSPFKDAIGLSFRDPILGSLCLANGETQTRHNLRWVRYGIPVFTE